MAQSLEAVRGELPGLREAIAFTDFEAFLASGAPTEPLPDVGPDDPVQIQYTSGTTGFPKGALLHHRGLTNNARLTLGRFDFAPGEAYVNPFPLFHTAGCGLGALGCVSHQLAHVPVLAFESGLMLDLIETERAAALAGVPTVLIALTEDPGFDTRDLSSVRAALSGGALVAPDLVKRIEDRLGVRFSIIYGQTESSPVITQGRLDDSFDDRATTIGRPLPQTEVRIVDPATGETVPCGVVGELCTRGYLVMHGYYEMPDATAAAIDGDGWLHTGDLASMDDRGYCRIEGRLKDMIIRGGENIFPREIEQRLFTHPAVGDVAVVGIPDEKWGEQVCAFVRAAPGATPRQGRAGRLRPRGARGVQGAAHLGLRGRVPDDAVGQGAEVRPARPLRRRRPAAGLDPGLRRDVAHGAGRGDRVGRQPLRDVDGDDREHDDDHGDDVDDRQLVPRPRQVRRGSRSAASPASPGGERRDDDLVEADSANASSAPAISAERICGNVMSRNVRAGASRRGRRRPPRARPASAAAARRRC